MEAARRDYKQNWDQLSMSPNTKEEEKKRGNYQSKVALKGVGLPHMALLWVEN